MTMTVQTILPRGIRNNNPLNIRLIPDNRWQGRLSPRLNSDGAFEQFQDPIMGLRAAAVLLIAHYDRRNAGTASSGCAASSLDCLAARGEKNY